MHEGAVARQARGDAGEGRRAERDQRLRVRQHHKVRGRLECATVEFVDRPHRLQPATLMAPTMDHGATLLQENVLQILRHKALQDASEVVGAPGS